MTRIPIWTIQNAFNKPQNLTNITILFAEQVAANTLLHITIQNQNTSTGCLGCVNEPLAVNNLKQQVPEVKQANGSENNFFSFIRRRNGSRFALCDLLNTCHFENEIMGI